MTHRFAVAAIFISALAVGISLPLSIKEVREIPTLLHAEHASPVTILAFGDMMLDRVVRAQIGANGAEYPFANIKEFLSGNDIVVANAEGVFSSNESVTGNNSGILRFTFDSNILSTLKSLHFDVLSQANNHAYDFDAAAFAESARNIRAAGLESFGDPHNQNPGPLYKEVNGTTVAFVGYHQFTSTSDDKVLAAIAQAHARGAFTIVYPHWGEEYLSSYTPKQQELGRTFIDMGADLVLGAHPHVIEPIEIYNGKAIFYSLGNFVFDQSFSQETSEGLAVHITLHPSSVIYTLYPFDISKAQVTLMEGNKRDEVLSQHDMVEQFALER